MTATLALTQVPAHPPLPNECPRPPSAVYHPQVPVDLARELAWAVHAHPNP
jgi:hypothetical protein